MHDFDVHLADGRTVAIEVTRFTDDRYVQQRAEIQKRSWVFPNLQRGWSLIVQARTPIGQLHQEVGNLLEVLEAKQVQRLRMKPRPDSPTDPAVKGAFKRLAELGVVTLGALGAIPAGQLILSTYQPGGSTGQDLIVEMIDSMVQNKLDKLLRAEADERHLFIWVEVAQPMTRAALAFADGSVRGLVLPDPVLPDGIDAVWIVEAALPTPIRVYRMGQGWTVQDSWQPST
jgi:hypothetical protein